MTAVVSVVIPCYRQAHFLSDALESVLGQSYGDFDVIVVDDGSPDDTSAVVARFAARDPRVRCVRQPNGGLARARNAGLSAAGATYVVFLDADDRLLPDALAAGVRALEQNPLCVFTRGQFEIIDVGGRLLDEEVDSGCPTGDQYELLLRKNWIWVPAAVMYRRSVFAESGAFDPRVDAAADLDLYLRLARLHPVHCHQTRVAQYRRHAASMSTNPAVMAPAVHRVLAAQRPFVAGEPRWRDAYRQAIAEWERRYLIPMMRLTIRRLVGAGDPRPLLAGLPLIAAYGPMAVARRVIRRSRARFPLRSS